MLPMKVNCQLGVVQFRLANSLPSTDSRLSCNDVALLKVTFHSFEGCLDITCIMIIGIFYIFPLNN